jgi:multidrug resistance efflux pump
MHNGGRLVASDNEPQEGLAERLANTLEELETANAALRTAVITAVSQEVRISVGQARIAALEAQNSALQRQIRSLENAPPGGGGSDPAGAVVA